MEKYYVFNVLEQLHRYKSSKDRVISNFSKLGQHMYHFINSYFEIRPGEVYRFKDKTIEEIQQEFIEERDRFIKENTRGGRKLTISSLRIASKIAGRKGIVERGFSVSIPPKNHVFSINEGTFKDSNRNYQPYDKENYVKPMKYKRCVSLLISDSDIH